MIKLMELKFLFFSKFKQCPSVCVCVCVCKQSGFVKSIHVQTNLLCLDKIFVIQEETKLTGQHFQIAEHGYFSTSTQ